MDEHSPTWRVIIQRSAKRALRRLPKDLLNRIGTAIDQLAQNPRPTGYVKLTDHKNLYRIRVGGWRIIYAIEDEKLIILVVEIGRRGGIYRNL